MSNKKMIGKIIHDLFRATLVESIILLLLLGFVSSCSPERDEARKLVSLENARSNPMAIAFSPNDKMFAVITEDDEVQVWLTPRNKRYQTFSFSEDASPASLTFSPDSQHLAVNTDKEIQIWDIENNQLLRAYSLADLSPGIGTIAYSPDSLFLGLNAGGFLRIWDTQTGEIITNADMSSRDYFTKEIVFSPNSDLVAFYTSYFFVWDIESNKLVATIPEGPDSFAFKSDGSEIISTQGNTVSRWRMPNGELIDTFDVQARSTLIALPPDGNVVFGISIDKSPSEVNDEALEQYLFSTSMWNVQSGELLWSKPTKGIDIFDLNDLVSSPSGNRVAMIGLNNGIHLWQIR